MEWAEGFNPWSGKVYADQEHTVFTKISENVNVEDMASGIAGAAKNIKSGIEKGGS